MILLKFAKGIVAFVMSCLVLSPVVLQAQDADEAKIEVGAKVVGSYNDSYAKSTSYYRTEPLLGGSIGAYGTYSLDFLLPKLKVQAELLLATRGVKLSQTTLASETSPYYFDNLWQPTPSQSYPGYVNSYTVQKQSFYLDIPVGLTYEVYQRITVQAGGMVSIYLDEYQSRVTNSWTTNFQMPDNLRYEQNMFFSVYAGAAYKFDFGLSAGARYNLGLTETFQQIRYERAGREIMPYSFQIFASYPIFKF